MLRTCLCAALLTLTWTGRTPAAEPTAEEVARAQADVNAYFTDLKVKLSQPPRHIQDKALERVLPNKIFFAVYFRRYPKAVLPPKGLAPSNVFLGDPVRPLTDPPSIAKTLREYLQPVKTDDEAKDVGRALRLTQELQQDGYYTFQLMDDATKVKEENGLRTVTAKAVVMKGGSGDLTIELAFDSEGKLAKFTEKATLKPGPRPKCQATLLLHPDPDVRRMVEANLLYLGRSARGYLDEQRATASPELQAAIDRIWQRICEQDR